jgi:hypothetical protein
LLDKRFVELTGTTNFLQSRLLLSDYLDFPNLQGIMHLQS